MANYLTTIYPDLKLKLALELDLKDLLNLCLTDMKMNKLCNQENLWILKSQQDFGYDGTKGLGSWKEKYIHLYQIFSQLNSLYNNIEIKYFKHFKNPRSSKKAKCHLVDSTYATNLKYINSDEDTMSLQIKLENDAVERAQIKNNMIKDGYNLVRGDILVLLFLDPGYRNDGLMIYDGDNIVKLDDVLDEYGSVPSQFKVITEFPILYWSEIIGHNMIVHFDLKSVGLVATLDQIYTIDTTNPIEYKKQYVYLFEYNRNNNGNNDDDENNNETYAIVNFTEENLGTMEDMETIEEFLYHINNDTVYEWSWSDVDYIKADHVLSLSTYSK